MDHDASHDPVDERAGLVARTRSRATALAETSTSRIDELRGRFRPLDVGFRIYERDKAAAGTLLGSALALRLFLFFLPLVLTAVGVAGVLGRHGGVGSVSSSVRATGTLADQIDSAFDQGATTPWIAIGMGLFGIASTGRSLTRALVLSSALSSQMGGHQKLRVRAIGAVVGLMVGMALAAALMNRVRAAAGLAVASVSYLAVAGVYLLLWLLIFLALPRATSDPAAALPGAAIMAVGMTLLQMITQLYLPHQIESASNLYGTIGAVIATLGWFFFFGRTIAFSFAVNAVLWEQIGSVSTFVFGLPGIRVIPTRVPSVARFFDLDHRPDETPDEPADDDRVGDDPGASPGSPLS